VPVVPEFVCGWPSLSRPCHLTRRPRLWRPGESQFTAYLPITITRHEIVAGSPGVEPKSYGRTWLNANSLTSLLAWLAVDSRRTTGIYFASDSRRTFSDGSYLDDCAKLFAPSKSPDIFAMLGQDITFPARAMPEICAQIDEGRIPAGVATSMYGRLEWVLGVLRSMKAARPGGGDFTIFHGSRNAFGMKATFAISRYRFVGGDEKWLIDELDLQTRASHAVAFDGSGHEAVFDEVARLKVATGSVSRVHFAGLCAALRDQTDPLSGGAPQLLGLGSVGKGRHYGVVMPSGTFFKGCPVLPADVPADTQWRDQAFEPVDEGGASIRNRRRKVERG
jgi:hypothetical protein